MNAITSFTGQYRFLSNFAPSQFQYEHYGWPTAEHAFQAMKNPDPTARSAYAAIRTAPEAKKQGHRQPMRHDWESVKRRIMLEILLAKFSQNGELRHLLAQTAPSVLVEGNTWNDTYWGCVRAETRPRLIMPLWGEDKGWAGHNWLGRCLMMAREVLS